LFWGTSVRTVGQRAQALVDATALAVFAVAGAIRALDSGLVYSPVLLLGCVTAIGGGALRNVLGGRTPRVVERGELYAIVVLAAAAAFLVCNATGISRTLAASLGFGIGFVFRLLALRFRWETEAFR
jgi:uncharacterized membrane protein YeiH